MLTSESPDQDDRLKWVFATNDEFNIDIYKYRKIQWVAGEVGTTGERWEATQGSTSNCYVYIQILGAWRARASYAHHIYMLVGPNVYFKT